MSSNANPNPQVDTRAMLIQLMWFWAFLTSIVSLLACGFGLVDSLENAPTDPTSFFDPRTLENGNPAFAQFAGIVLGLFMSLSALMSICGFMFVIRSVGMLGTLRGRGIYFIFLGIAVGGWGGIMGVIAFVSNVLAGLVHFIGGCCFCRPSARAIKAETAYYSAYMSEVNPEFTRATANFENRVTQSFGGTPIDYYGEEEY